MVELGMRSSMASGRSLKRQMACTCRPLSWQMRRDKLTPSPVRRKGILAESFSRMTRERDPGEPWKRAVGFVRRTSMVRSSAASGRRHPLPSVTLTVEKRVSHWSIDIREVSRKIPPRERENSPPRCAIGFGMMISNE